MSTTPGRIAVAQDGPRFRWPPIIIALLAIGACAVVGAVAADRPIIAAAGLAAVLLGLASVIRPEIATLIVVFLLYSNAAVVAVTRFGMPLFIGAIVPMILVVPLGYELLIKRQKIVITPAFPWVAGFLLVQILGVLFARDMSDAMAGLITFLLEGVGLYLLVVNVVRTPAAMRNVIWTLLAVGAFLGGLSVFQAATGTYSSDYFGFAQSDKTNDLGITVAGLARLAGPIGEKNRYAQIMLMLVPLALFQAWTERRRVLKLAAYGVAVLASGAVILTFSRGAAVGFAMVIVVMTLLRYIKPIQLFAVLMLAVALLIAVPQYAERLTSLNPIVDAITGGGDSANQADHSITSRATENLAALAVFSDHPIIGVGPGEFSSYYREYANDIAISVKAEDRQAHNLYLATAAETGVLGLICLMAVLAVTLWELAKARRKWIGRRTDLANMATAFSLSVLTYMTTGIFLHLSYARYFWLIMALAGATAAIALAEPDPDEKPKAHADPYRGPRVNP
jgi:putative inorganic carbon (HCO3(-)) transporter